MNKKKFFQNAFLLIFSTLVLRLIFTAFRVVVSNKVGAECMGLYQLTFAVYNIAATFATSGINFATTRLCAMSLSNSDRPKTKNIVNKSLLYSLVFGISAFCVIFLFAEPIGEYVLCDKRSVLSLKALAVSLPFISVSSALSGYFYAEKKVSVTLLDRASEQIAQIAAFFILLSAFPKGSVEQNCLFIVLSGAISEILGSLFLTAKFAFDNRKIKSSKDRKTLKKVSGTAFSAAASMYLKSGLQTVENILIPLGFKKYGANASQALSGYGILGSMVMPIIFFPSFVLSSFSMLLVPEFSASQAQNKEKDIRSASIITVRLTLLFALFISANFIVFGRGLGNALYSEQKAGSLIKIMAPLIPFMYLDSVADGMLKGLGEYNKVIKYSTIDTVVSILLIFFVIPKTGLYGYVLVIYVSSILNAFLSIRRLLVVTKNKIRVFSDITVPFSASLFSAVCVKSLFPSHLFSKTAVVTISLCLSSLLTLAFIMISKGRMYESVKYAVDTVRAAVFKSNFRKG